MRKFSIILVLSSTLLVACDAKLSTECLVDYLQLRNVQDEVLASIGKFSGDPVTCSNDVKAKVDDILGVVRSNMEANIKKKPHADCAMREVESDPKFETLSLLAEVVELKGVGLKFWKISSKNSKIQEFRSNAQEIVDGAIIKCKGQADYSAFFDSFYEQKKNEPMTDDLDYCIRKYLLDKSAIQTSKYGFAVNPKNLRVNNINCDEIMKTTLELMRTNISSAGSACVINTFVDQGYLDLIMKIHVLTKLHLTSAEKEEEKQNFVNSMIAMTHAIKACPMKP